MLLGHPGRSQCPAAKPISSCLCQSFTIYIPENFCTDTWQSAVMCSRHTQQVRMHPPVTVCKEEAVSHRVIIGLPDWVSALAPATAQCWRVICLMLAVGDLGQIRQQVALTRLAPALLGMLLALCGLGLLCSCLSRFLLQMSCLRCALLDIEVLHWEVCIDMRQQSVLRAHFHACSLRFTGP